VPPIASNEERPQPAANTASKRAWGRPFPKGVSGNPKGCPRGSRHSASLFAEKLLSGESEELVRKVIELAKGGDVAALKLCFDRILPAPKSRPVRFRLPEVRTITDASNALTALIAGLASGKLLPEDVEALTAPIVSFIKAKI
jgi:Family of unknown function (DUF5681)